MSKLMKRASADTNVVFTPGTWLGAAKKYYITHNCYSCFSKTKFKADHEHFETGMCLNCTNMYAIDVIHTIHICSDPV